MFTTPDRFASLLRQPTGASLQTLDASVPDLFDELAKRCVAVYNSYYAGGHVIIGLSAEPVREVTGTKAFSDVVATEARLSKAVKLDVRLEEYEDGRGRVLLAHVPAVDDRILADYEGYCYAVEENEIGILDAKAIESATELDHPYDYSALLSDAVFTDLDVTSVVEFKRMCVANGKGELFPELELDDFLRSVGLMAGDRVTNAGLILFGTEQTLRDNKVPAKITIGYQIHWGGTAMETNHYNEGYFACKDKIWDEIDRRNLDQVFWDRNHRRRERTFNKDVLTEAIVNAVAHRLYNYSTAVLVKQLPESITISNYGGLPRGLEPDLVTSLPSRPRNRLLAHALRLAGLMSNEGLGLSKMVSETIKQGKPAPDFSNSDRHWFHVKFDGQVENEDLAIFLNSLPTKTTESLTPDHLKVLIPASCQEPIWDARSKRILEELVEADLVVKLTWNRKAYHYLKTHDFKTPNRISEVSQQAIDDGVLKAAMFCQMDGWAGADSIAECLRSDENTDIVPELEAMTADSLLVNISDEWLITSLGKAFLLCGDGQCGLIDTYDN